MKSVVGFEKAKTTLTQTRVPARLTRGGLGADTGEWPKAGLDRGASQCQPEKAHKNGEAERQSKPELTRCRESPQAFIQLRTDVASGYNKASEFPQGRAAV